MSSRCQKYKCQRINLLMEPFWVYQAHHPSMPIVLLLGNSGNKKIFTGISRWNYIAIHQKSDRKLNRSYPWCALLRKKWRQHYWKPRTIAKWRTGFVGKCVFFIPQRKNLLTFLDLNPVISAAIMNINIISPMTMCVEMTRSQCNSYSNNWNIQRERDGVEINNDENNLCKEIMGSPWIKKLGIYYEPRKKVTTKRSKK